MTKENMIMQTEKITNLSLSKLAAFENHPFRVVQDEEFNKLVGSIRENGILIPAIARPKGDGYELIAGHRRKFACQILDIGTMPVIVRDMTDDQAVCAMVDSNVQRENVLPSEKAFAYRMRLEATKRQAGRPSSNPGQVGPNLETPRSNAIVATENGESIKQVQRYIRLTELIPQLLQMVDDKRIAFNPAVELSYLPKEQQEQLMSVMEAEQSTPSLAQAQKLKALSGQGALTVESLSEVMREQKANQKEQVKIPYDRVREILKRDMPLKEVEDYILKAVADYHKRQLQRERNRDAR